MIDRYSLDANVILRYLLRDDEGLYRKAESIFIAIESGEIEGYLDSVNLGEVVWVLKSFYQLPLTEIRDGLLSILKLDHLIMDDKDRYVTALTLYAHSVKHFGDACACTAAVDHCAGRLFSFDRKLDRVPGILRKEQY